MRRAGEGGKDRLNGELVHVNTAGGSLFSRVYHTEVHFVYDDCIFDIDIILPLCADLLALLTLAEFISFLIASAFCLTNAFSASVSSCAAAGAVQKHAVAQHTKRVKTFIFRVTLENYYDLI